MYEIRSTVTPGPSGGGLILYVLSQVAIFPSQDTFTMSVFDIFLLVGKKRGDGFLCQISKNHHHDDGT